MDYTIINLGDLMKIVFYNKTILSGGIEKCIESLSKYIYKDYELEVVYTDESKLDNNIVNILSKYAKVYKIEEGMNVDCDICIWCYLYFDYTMLKNIIHAKKYICWIHSMPRILPDCLLDNEEFVKDCSNFICVSEAVKNNLNISKNGQVIHNFMSENIIEIANIKNPFEGTSPDTLKLSVVSRLSNGKGFDRLLLLVKELENSNIKYNLQIIGKGRSKEEEIKNDFSPYPSVIFAGYQENPYTYIKNSDYLVQLSDDESWCNVITEAKILHVPVVITNFESAKEQIVNNINGIIVDLKETDYKNTINNMVTQKEYLKNNLKDFTWTNEVDKWYEILKVED